MKKIITAINNPIINEKLKKEKIEVIGKDIQYKEGILEILENNKEINFILIDEKLPGEIKNDELINKIKKINKNIEIILFIKKENKKNAITNEKEIMANEKLKSKIKIIVAIMTDPCYNAASKNIKKLFLMPSEKGSRTGAGVRMRVHHVCRCGVHGRGGH